VTKTSKIILILSATCLCIIAAFFVPPIAQDPAYHNFTDSRALYGINNFWNVASNATFILFGLLGLYRASRHLPAINMRKLQGAYTLFFTSAILIGFGSSYYHFNPSTNALLWDRLPMAFAFMSLFSIIIAEYISLASGRLLFIPLLFAGTSSVIYWFYTEQLGAGDLRAYVVVQFLPLLLIPAILIMFRSSGKSSIYIWALIFVYLLSKAAEYFDADIFKLSGDISGHSAKHLLASLGVLLIYFHFSKRTRALDE
jgi:hypothetical protein